MPVKLKKGSPLTQSKRHGIVMAVDQYGSVRPAGRLCRLALDHGDEVRCVRVRCYMRCRPGSKESSCG